MSCFPSIHLWLFKYRFSYLQFNSSDPSWQSKFPSQTCSFTMHLLLSEQAWKGSEHIMALMHTVSRSKMYPVVHRQLRPCGFGKQIWLHPPRFSEQPFLPRNHKTQNNCFSSISHAYYGKVRKHLLGNLAGMLLTWEVDLDHLTNFNSWNKSIYDRYYFSGHYFFQKGLT